MDALNEILTHTFGPHVPPELQSLAEKIAADGVVTDTERVQLMDEIQTHVMRNSTRQMIGEAAFYEF